MESARMGPVNATVRFVCELVALYGIGAGAWAVTDAVVVAVVLPLAVAIVWGVFRVPDDPGAPPIEVPGAVRLAIEAVVLGGGAVGLWLAHGPVAGIGFGAILVVHYATTPRRLGYVLACRGWGRAGEGPAPG